MSVQSVIAPLLKKTKKHTIRRQYPGVNANIDDYIVVRVTRAETSKGCNPMNEVIAVPKTATIAELGEIYIRYMAKYVQSFRWVVEVFFTTDFAGKIPIGDDDDTVDTRLQDMHLIYESYRLEKGRWGPSSMQPYVSRDTCQLCNVSSPNHLIRVASGFTILHVCKRCTEKNVYSCHTCYRPDATASKFDANICAMVAGCKNKKRCIPSPDRRCHSCSIPLDIVRKCGRCREVIYCSRECQRYDWVDHRDSCTPKSMANNVD